MENFTYKAEEAADYIKNRLRFEADTALVLGTGLHKLEEIIEVVDYIPYEEIPHYPVSTIEKHNNKLIAGKINNNHVFIQSGRFHYYEGYDMQQVCFYVEVLKLLNVDKLILTNAVGSVNPHYNTGDIVLITDHINMFPQNPLRGPNFYEKGLRFPDMSCVYDKEFAKMITAVAAQENISLKKGVYWGWQGPSLETPAEYKMINRLGADVVGMSSIPEVIMAKYLQMSVSMISIVSNQCFPSNVIKETTIEDIISEVALSSNDLKRLLLGVMK